MRQHEEAEASPQRSRRRGTAAGSRAVAAQGLPQESIAAVSRPPAPASIEAAVDGGQGSGVISTQAKSACQAHRRGDPVLNSRYALQTAASTAEAAPGRPKRATAQLAAQRIRGNANAAPPDLFSRPAPAHASIAGAPTAWVPDAHHACHAWLLQVTTLQSAFIWSWQGHACAAASPMPLILPHPCRRCCLTRAADAASPMPLMPSHPCRRCCLTRAADAASPVPQMLPHPCR